MRPAHVIEIVTPKKFLLNGLWFGPKKPKRVIIWVHGLGSSAFSKIDIVEKLVDKNTAVMTFNNRGHHRISHLVPESGKKGAAAGEAYEIFTDCADDIQGAVNTARRLGAREVYLAGHSTGCQKAIYWAYKKAGKGVKGIVLLAPLSDYAAAVKFDRKGELARATSMAKRMVKRGEKKALLPARVWPREVSARRFLSLHTPDSIEQSIFSYFDPRRPARLYGAIRLPVFVMLAEKDEFADRDARRIAEWFSRHSGSKRYAATIIPRVGHGFRGAEREVARKIKQWILA